MKEHAASPVLIQLYPTNRFDCARWRLGAVSALLRLSLLENRRFTVPLGMLYCLSIQFYQSDRIRNALAQLLQRNDAALCCFSELQR